MEIDRYELLRNSLTEYVGLMESGLYFDAHEVLEDAWHPLRKSGDPLKNPVKGLINAAIAFEHIKRGRPGAEQRAIALMDSFKRRCTGEYENMPELHHFISARNCVMKIRKQYGEIFDVLVS